MTESRSLIALEVQAVDILHIKSMSKIRDNPRALIRLLRAFQAFLLAEKNLPIDPNMSNKKKKIIFARQHEIMEMIDVEIDRLYTTLEDARRFIFNYHKSRYHIYQTFLLYMQPIEEGLTVQKNKLLLRMEGFTKQIVDNIFDETKPGDIHQNSTYVELNKANNNINNTIIYKLQHASKELVSRNFLPEITYFNELFQWHSNDETIAKSIKDGAKLKNDYNPLKVPIVLLNALQYLDVLSSHNLTLFKQNHATFIQFKILIHTFISVIPEAFLIIKQWRHAAHLDLIGIFLFQTVQTLRSVLDMMLLLHLDMITPVPEGQAPSNPSTKSRTERSESESRMRNRSYDSSDEKPENESLPGSLILEDEEWETDQSEFWDNSFLSPLERKARKAATDHTLDNEHRYSMHHLATDLVLMLKVVKQARVHNGKNGNSRLIFTSHGSLSNYGVSDASELHGYTSTPKGDNVVIEEETLIVNKYDESIEIDDHINNSFNQFLKLVAGYTSLGSNLITNMLHCSDMVMTILIKTDKQYKTDSGQSMPAIPVVINTLPHELLTAALEVGQMCLAQYAVRVEGFNSLNSYSINDTAYVTACDNEAIAIITVATQSFSNCLPDTLALSILKMAHDLCISRCSAFLLVSAYFKCNLAACLWAINSSHLPEVSERDIKTLMDTQYQARVTTLLEEAGSNSRRKKQFSFARSNSNLNSATNAANKGVSVGAATPAVGFGVKRPTQLVAPTNAGKKASISIPESPVVMTKATLSIKVPPRVDMKFTLARRIDVISAVGESLLRVMGLMYLYRTTLSISHCGMMLVRLITRDLFIKKNKVDEFLTVMLSKQLLPLQEYLVIKKDTDDDDFPMASNTASNQVDHGFGSEQSSRATTPAASASNPANPNNVGTLDLADLSSVSRASTPQETDRRSVNSAGMSSRSNNSRNGNAVPSSEYVRTWKMNNMLNIVMNTGAPIVANARTTGGSRGGTAPGGPEVQHTAECSFVELLHFIGENHLQSGEVMEQLLLLVEHLATKSQLNKYLLIESGLLPVVQRIRDTTKWNNNYILALSEICIELIDI